MTFEPFTITVTEEVVDTMARALFTDVFRMGNYLDDTHRVRVERACKDKTHEVLERVATLQRAAR